MKRMLPYLVLAIGTVSPALVVADREPDADTVRQWVESGKVLPLEELLTRHRAKIPGRLLDIEVEQEHGRIVYELEVVDDRGHVHKVYLDAQSGNWLGRELDD